MVEVAREAEESKMVNKKNKKKTKHHKMATTDEIDQIEEKLEVASGNSSTGIQDVTRTQVYRKTPSIVNSPRERQKQ